MKSNIYYITKLISFIQMYFFSEYQGIFIINKDPTVDADFQTKAGDKDDDDK